MPDHDDLAPDALRDAVLAHLESDAEITAFEPIPTGKFNTSWTVSTEEGDYVLRVAPPDDAVYLFYERRMMHQEPDLHRLLRAETNVPVAEIVAFDAGRTLLPRDFLLMERLPGRALAEAPALDHDRVLWQTGECLAQVHRLTADRYGYLGAHRPMAPQPTWAEAFRVMWSKLLADVADAGFYGAATVRRMEALLEERLDLFADRGPARLLHMDIWSQNLLVDASGDLTGIVDWDRALWGDPEIEFAVLDYCGVSEPAFWSGYGAERDASPEAGVRRVFYLLYEIQKYIVIRAGRSGDRAAADRYARQSLGIAERAFGCALA